MNRPRFGKRFSLVIVALLLVTALAGCGAEATPTPTVPPPTAKPAATAAPATAVPATAVPPTKAPPTQVPPTKAPPTATAIRTGGTYRIVVSDEPTTLLLANPRATMGCLMLSVMVCPTLLTIFSGDDASSQGTLVENSRFSA